MTDWGIDAVLRELAGAGSGFGKALTELAEAGDYAERAAERMAAGQLFGIARGIGQIQAAIDAQPAGDPTSVALGSTVGLPAPALAGGRGVGGVIGAAGSGA